MCLLLGMLFLLPSLRADAQNADAQVLLNEVREIAAPGLPGPLSLYGKTAFPLVTARTGRTASATVVAAAIFGKGRVVAFGHTGYLDTQALQTADTGKLVLNSVRWLTKSGERGAARPKIGVRRHSGLLATLREQSLPAETLDGTDWITRLSDYAAVAVPLDSLSDAEIAALKNYLTQGGGLLAAELGWGWLQTHPGQTLTQHPGNRLLGAAGLVWADGTLDRTSGKGYAVVPAPPLVNADAALTAIITPTNANAPRKPAELAQAAESLTLAARSLPADDTLLRPRLAALEQKYAAKLTADIESGTFGRDPLDRLLYTLDF